MSASTIDQTPPLPTLEARVHAIVANILAASHRSATFAPHDMLTEIGLTSVDMISLMLDVERSFDLEIPQRDITPEAFHSVSTIAALLQRLTLGDEPVEPLRKPAAICVGLRLEAVTGRIRSPRTATTA